MFFCVYGAASNLIDSTYITAGEQLGRTIAENNHGVVYGGGANGMMGAVARGVRERGGELIGVAPTFFQVDGVLFEDCTEFVYTETMRQRKQIMEERSDGFIVTPGGIGTYDEFFEILSLRQLGRHAKPIVLFNINGYFDPLYAMLQNTANQSFMPLSNLDLFFISDNADEIVKYLETYEQQDINPSVFRNLIEEKIQK